MPNAAALAEVSTHLGPYGASVNDRGQIIRGDKVFESLFVSVKKARVQVRSTAGDLLFSGKDPASIQEFVERFWFWKKTND